MIIIIVVKEDIWLFRDHVRKIKARKGLSEREHSISIWLLIMLLIVSDWSSTVLL